VACLNSDIPISAKGLMPRIEEMVLVKKEELKKKWNGFQSKYSLTCNMWTLEDLDTYLEITLHYIDDDWKMQKDLLAFKYLEDWEDGLCLSKVLIDVLEDFGIAERLLGVTVDRATCQTDMMDHVEEYFRKHHQHASFRGTWNQVECMTHTLNRSAQDILKDFIPDSEKNPVHFDSKDEMVSAVSRLAILMGTMRDCPEWRYQMRQHCEGKGEEYLWPIWDVTTTWNRTFDKLMRAWEERDLITELIYNARDKEWIDLMLDDSDWNCVVQWMDVLRPFKEASESVCEGNESMMMTHVTFLFYFCMEMLKESLQKYEPSDTIYVAIQQGLARFMQYYDTISPMIGISLLLQPSMKKKFLIDSLGRNEEWVQNVQDQFESTFQTYSERYANRVDETKAINETKAMDLTKFPQMARYYKQRLVHPNETEWSRYLNDPCEPFETNPLKFWKVYSAQYPILSAMAKDFLTLQGSSVSSKRAFSPEPDVLPADWCSLSARMIERVVFLKFHVS
jgi:hypothetical protein